MSTISKQHQHVAIACFLLSLYLSPLFAASMIGTIRNASGEPLPVAMVSLFRSDNHYLETVYATHTGQYHLETGLHGELTLRVRSPGYADKLTTLKLDNDDVVKNDIRLDLLNSDKEISDSLTGSSQFSRVRLGDKKSQLLFQNDCISCHQLGNAYTRQPRGKEAWAHTIDRMLGFWTFKSGENPALVNKYAELLATAFDGTLVVKQERHEYDPVHAQTMIKEWKYPQALVAHDAVQHSGDGFFYTMDQGNDNVYITDPKTNITETFTLPANGMPVGGRLGGKIGNTSSSSFTARHAPHSLQEAKNGKFYMTDSFANQIGVFDPKTRSLKGYDVKDGASYPHTIRIDAKGVVWFSIANSNQVGRFDPATEDMRVINLPATSNRENFPGYLAYGIDVHPGDGSIWYSRLGAHKIGRIDPDTMEVQEFDPPFVGPRRLRFAADGTLWIPAFAEGAIARLNTDTMEYKMYEIPRLTSDGVEGPYALAVHPATDDVWITANMSDRMFQFIPAEERFIAYPLPTRGHYQRDIFFSKQGWVCGPSSPLPAGPTVEGGMQALICIVNSRQSGS
jgi:streptogramin lyase